MSVRINSLVRRRLADTVREASAHSDAELPGHIGSSPRRPALACTSRRASMHGSPSRDCASELTKLCPVQPDRRSGLVRVLCPNKSAFCRSGPIPASDYPRVRRHGNLASNPECGRSAVHSVIGDDNFRRPGWVRCDWCASLVFSSFRLLVSDYCARGERTCMDLSPHSSSFSVFKVASNHSLKRTVSRCLLSTQ